MKLARRCLASFAAVAGIALLPSCSTLIWVTRTLPPAMDVGGAESVAVLPFGVPQDGTGGMDSYQASVVRRLLGYRGPVQAGDVALAKRLAEVAAGKLGASSRLAVASPSDIDSICEAYRSGGGISPRYDIYLLGELDQVDRVEETTTRTQVDATGKSVTVPDKVYRTLKIQFTYRVIAGKDGKIIGQKSLRDERREVSSLHPTAPPARSFEDLAAESVPVFMDDLAAQLLTSESLEFRALEPDRSGDQRMAEAERLAKQKSYAKAAALYLAVYDASGNAAAGYNAALMLELRGDLETAIALMQKLWKAGADPKAKAELDRMLRAREDLIRLGSLSGART